MASFNSSSLKRTPTAFLQGVIVLIGVVALAILLWEPHVEGRNANATIFQVYFHDPFLAYAYLGSIPFFVALYRGFQVLGYAGRNQIFSLPAVNALRTIKLCAITLVGFVVVGEIFILTSSEDDKAGGVFLGVAISFGSIVMATAAAAFEQILQRAVDLKSENDLTV